MLQLKMPQFPLPRSGQRAFVLALIAISFGVASCDQKSGGGDTSTSPNTTSPTTSTSSAGGGGGGGAGASLSGAGATFPAPLYQKWFSDYNKQHPEAKIGYQAVGSGTGISQFTKGTVDFGASDVAMKDEEIAKVKNGVVLLPMTAGSIVIAYNIPGVKSGLKLPRQVYPAIFLGQIKKWNDPAITKVNPGVNLPDLPITVVYRSEGSGTTSVFTSHLSAVSPDWKSKVGSGKNVNWPGGVGGKGNPGVIALIQQTKGSVGYVEYGFAAKNNVPYASLENKSQKYVEATPDSASKTLAAVTLPENLRAFITDPEGADSYPIVTYTWLLAYKKYDDANKSKTLKEVIKYGLTQGQKDSAELGYIPLPSNVVTKVQAAADTIQP